MEKKVQNFIWVLIGLVIVVAAVAIIMAFLFEGRYYNGSYGPFGMMGNYGFGILMPVIGAVTVIFILLFIYFIFEALRGSDNKDETIRTRHAEDIAGERLAKGEITEEEYKRIIETLRK